MEPKKSGVSRSPPLLPASFILTYSYRKICVPLQLNFSIKQMFCGVSLNRVCKTLIMPLSLEGSTTRTEP